MKLLGQLSLAVAVIVLLVAGVTFIAQYQSGGIDPPSPQTASSAAIPVNVPELKFPIAKVEWQPAWVGDVEEHSGGYHDFWFTNDSKTPIDLGFYSASCKCTSVEVCLLTPEKAKQYELWAHSAAVSPIAFGSSGTLSSLSRLTAETVAAPKMLGVQPNWQVAISTEEKPFEKNGLTVPPGYSGIVRMIWAPRKDKLGAQLLSVALWSQPTEGEVKPRQVMALELPVNFVSPVRISPVTRNLENISSRETRVVEFLCWSSTRAGFPLEVYEWERHPCITTEWSSLGPLEREEKSKLTNSRVLCGYTVKVTVRERLDDANQMDLGPFARRLTFKSSAELDEGAAMVTGVIRGEVTVGDEKSKGKASLGTFKARLGASANVPIAAERYGLEIDTNPNSIRFEPESLQGLLKATLKKVSEGAETRGRWNLHLQVEPGALSGNLPDRSAIYLRIPGNPVRQIRIPVEALAYQ